MADEVTNPKGPEMGEIAVRETPTDPLQLRGHRADLYIDLLVPDDSVLSSKGGISNLKIYKELLRDDQVASVWQQRRLALTACELVIEPGADDPASKAAAEALQEDMARINWDDITDKALYAVFYGWGVAEVIWRADSDRVRFDRIVIRERGRFRFDRFANLFLYSSGTGEYVRMPDRKFWSMRAGADNHDEPYGLGLAHSLYWPVFFKRNDLKFWLVFLEKFGQPTTLAKLPPGATVDTKKMAEAKAMLRNIATDAGVVVPDNVVVELLEATRSGAADYEAMSAAMNAAISKIVVGQTMTTDNGSSLSQAKVHQAVGQAITQADSDLLCGSFNASVVQWWTEFNFPGATPPKVYRNTEPPEDLNARAERDSKIIQLGYEPTQEYIDDHYGEGWVKKAVQAPAIGPVDAMGRPVMQQPGDADPQASFAEAELAALQALKAARRADQQSLIEAAKVFAGQYETVLGRQVGALLQAADFSEDYETFRAQLEEILSDGPSPEAEDKVTRIGFFAHLMGALRGQR